MPTASPHLPYLRKCLTLATNSPPRPTNFRVGALLLSRAHDPSSPIINASDDRILSTGYTMELSGNTHAEQCCLSNYAAVHGVPDNEVGAVLPDEPGRRLLMYVTMEPCGRRLSGNVPCVRRIIETRMHPGEDGRGKRGIEKVYFGVKEPGTFVGESEGCRMLTEAGVEWELVQGLEREILEVAVAGHEDAEGEVRRALEGVETRLEDVSEEERRRQEGIPPNPKKRVMEVKLDAGD